MNFIKSVSKKRILSIALVIVLCLTGMNVPTGKNLKGNEKVSVFDEIVKPNVSENKLTDISEIALSDGEKAAELVNSYKDDVDYEAALNYALTAYYKSENFDEMKDFTANIDNRSKEIVKGYKMAAKEREQGTDNGYIPGEAIVMFDENTTEEEINAVVEAEYGECDEVVKLVNGQTMAVVSISLGQTVDMAVDAYDDYSVTDISGANTLSEVTDVASDYVNDPNAYQQYYLDYINAKDAWNYVSQKEHRKVLVGVIDTGVQMDHPDLKNIISPYSADVTGDTPVLLSESEQPYIHMHGTFITGIIAAEANNNNMFAGIASCYNNDVVEVLNVQAATDEGGPLPVLEQSDTVKAINYCAEQGVEVINMSFGVLGSSCIYSDLIDDLSKEGIVFVASAGNDSSSATYYPSEHPNVISVVATNKANEKASFSNYGMKKDICAPGESIYSTTIDSKMDSGQGTSYAAPVVVATVALMRSLNSNIKVDNARQILSDTSRNIGIGDKCKNGLIDTYSAVKMAAEYTEEMSTKINLAKNKTVKVSEGTSFDENKYPLSNLIDGDKNTDWICSSQQYKTIIIDLEDECVVDEIQVDYNGMYSGYFTPYISLDARNWIDVSSSLKASSAVSRTIDLDIVKTRYIRLEVVSTSNIGFEDIYVWGYNKYVGSQEYEQIEVPEPKVSYVVDDYNLLSINISSKEQGKYGFNVYVDGIAIIKGLPGGYGMRMEDGEHEVRVTATYMGNESKGVVFKVFIGGVIPEKLSDGKPAYSSSDEWEGYAAKYAVDDSAGTRWASLATDDEWIYVDLEDTYSISKVELDWENAYGKAYNIQVSNDAVNWKTVKSITDSDGGEDVIEFEPIDARYVKMQGVKRATGYGYSLWDFDVYGGEATGNTGDDNSDDGNSGDNGSDDNNTGNNNNTPVNVNLAANKTGASSSNEGDNVAASNAFDTNMGTRWSSQFNDDNWIYVDLGQTYSVDKVVLNWEGAYGKDYNIDVSTDGVEWTTVSELRNQNGGEDVVTFDLTDARYVRMNGVARGTGYGYSLWEMEVYCTVENSGNNGSGNEGGNQDDNEGGNQDDNKTSELISQGKTATSSSDEWEGYAASYAFDGNTGSRWASSWTDNEWIYVDLGQTYTVDKVVLNWEGAYGKDYNIDVSTDGVEWTTVSELRNQNGGEDEITFNATNARYVRMTGIARGTGYGYSLFEMNVYGY